MILIILGVLFAVSTVSYLAINSVVLGIISLITLLGLAYGMYSRMSGFFRN